MYDQYEYSRDRFDLTLNEQKKALSEVKRAILTPGKKKANAEVNKAPIEPPEEVKNEVVEVSDTETE